MWYHIPFIETCHGKVHQHAFDFYSNFYNKDVGGICVGKFVLSDQLQQACRLKFMFTM